MTISIFYDSKPNWCQIWCYPLVMSQNDRGGKVSKKPWYIAGFGRRATRTEAPGSPCTGIQKNLTSPPGWSNV
jgi:hypothetical protein